MLRFKISAMFGFLLALLVFAPSASHAQNSKPTPSPSPTPTVNANIVNTPAVTLAPEAQVGIDQTRNTVKVDTSAPLPVRDVAASGREPVFIDLGGLLRNQNYGSCCDSMYESNITYTVPAGKRLIIEQAFINVRVPAGAKVSGFLLITTATNSGGSYERIPVVFTQQGSDVYGRSIFVASQAAKLYLNPEAGKTKRVSVEVIPQSNDDSSGHFLYISGYLEDAQ